MRSQILLSNARSGIQYTRCPLQVVPGRVLLWISISKVVLLYILIEELHAPENQEISEEVPDAWYLKPS